MERVQDLDRHECLRLLAQRRLGRVAFSERALPAILPVTYSMVGQNVLLGTTAGGLGHRLDGQVVAFAVDDLDEDVGTGWSVVVTGTARLVKPPRDLMRYDAALPGSVAEIDHEGRVSITSGDVVGRRILTAFLVD